MSLEVVGALCVSGLPLMINQLAQFEDIEDDRSKADIMMNQQSGMCLKVTTILGGTGSVLSITLYAGAKSISKLSPKLGIGAVSTVCLLGGAAGVAGIYFKVDKMRQVWKYCDAGLSEKKKITRAALDGALFAATAGFTIAGCLAVNKVIK